MIHPRARPELLYIIAQEIHEHFRRRIESFPAWEDLNESAPWHAGLIRLAYDQARDFVAIVEMNGT